MHQHNIEDDASEAKTCAKRSGARAKVILERFWSTRMALGLGSGKMSLSGRK